MGLLVHVQLEVLVLDDEAAPRLLHREVVAVGLGGQVQLVLALRALLLAVDRLACHVRPTGQDVQIVAVLAALPQAILHMFVAGVRREIVMGHLKVLERRELRVCGHATAN